jgi:hypothetical protein
MSPGRSRDQNGGFASTSDVGSKPGDTVSLWSERHPDLIAVLESAAALQKSVPDAVLVGGSVAAMYAGHRLSFDHDHVLTDLMSRYEAVLEAVEATEGWATSVKASRPPMTLMGSLGGIEAGLRQLRRKVPLETVRVAVPNGEQVTVPTLGEALRVKAYLVVVRNQVRDYLDVVALADRLGGEAAAAVLRLIDDYYLDRSEDGDSVATILVQRLAEPNPRDDKVIEQLSSYKGLTRTWQDWSVVTAACNDLAQLMLEAGEAMSERSDVGVKQ